MLKIFTALSDGFRYDERHLYETSEGSKKGSKCANAGISLEDRQFEMTLKYTLTFDEERKIREYILSGEHYEEICAKFQEDFKLIFKSDDWKDKLHIPGGRCPYKELHFDMVYMLILANKGKVDSWFLTSGYELGGRGIDNEILCLEFFKRLEKLLRDKGVHDSFVVRYRPSSKSIVFRIQLRSGDAKLELDDLLRELTEQKRKLDNFSVLD